MGVRIEIAYDGQYIDRIYQVNATGSEPTPKNEVLYDYLTSQNHDPVLDLVQHTQTTFYEYNGSLDTFSNQRKKVAYDYNLGNAGHEKYNLLAIKDGRGNLDEQSPYAVVQIVYTGDDRVEVITTAPNYHDTDYWTQVEFTDYVHDPDEGFPRTATYVLRGYDSVTQEFGVALKQVYTEYDPITAGLLKLVIESGDGEDDIATCEFERDCVCNQVTRIKDPEGRVEWRQLDQYGNLVKRIVDDGNDGETSVKEYADMVTLYKFDLPNYVNSSKFGGLVEKMLPAMVVQPGSISIWAVDTDDFDDDVKTVYSYDGTGNLTKVTLPVFHEASEFDPQTEHTATLEYAHNSWGQVTSLEVKLDSTTLRKREYEYYPTTNDRRRGLLYRVIDDPTSMALTTTYDYDDRRDLTKITDPRQNDITITRTGDRLIACITPATRDNDKVEYGYDANSNLAWESVGGNGAQERFKTFYTYDKASQLITATRQVKWNGSGYDTVSTEFAYEGEGRIQKITEKPGGDFMRYRRYEYSPDVDPVTEEWILVQGMYYSATGLLRGAVRLDRSSFQFVASPGKEA